uniref:Uncharacterized protein n=1 Tax=Sphaerodactylus townsendi TaxID=933632 RepID=A0ACB8EXI5_9SAUR
MPMPPPEAATPFHRPRGRAKEHERSKGQRITGESPPWCTLSYKEGLTSPTLQKPSKTCLVFSAADPPPHSSSPPPFVPVFFPRFWDRPIYPMTPEGHSSPFSSRVG